MEFLSLSIKRHNLLICSYSIPLRNDRGKPRLGSAYKQMRSLVGHTLWGRRLWALGCEILLSRPIIGYHLVTVIETDRYNWLVGYAAGQSSWPIICRLAKWRSHLCIWRAQVLNTLEFTDRLFLSIEPVFEIAFFTTSEPREI